MTLVDRANHHLFQPLLYQVATAGLSPAEIASPIRRILRRQTERDRAAGRGRRASTSRRRRSLLADGEVAYDYLIVATGATHSYFGHDEWEPHAPGLKTLDDALEIRRRVLLAFEQAEREADAERAPAVAHLRGDRRRAHRASRWRARWPRSRATPWPASSGASTRGRRGSSWSRRARASSPPIPTTLSRERGPAARRPRRAGLDRRRGHRHRRPRGRDRRRSARGADRGLGGGRPASPLARALGAPLDRAGRVKVKPDLTRAGPPRGLRHRRPRRDRAGRPAGAGRGPRRDADGPARRGEHRARALRGEPLVPVPLPRQGLARDHRPERAASPWFGGLRSSRASWPGLAWLAIHIFFLIGFRNRFVVMVTWAWAYLTYERSARLIFGRTNDDGVRTRTVMRLDWRLSPPPALAERVDPAQRAGSAQSQCRWSCTSA